MIPVEIVPVPGGSIVLRARGSELLILDHHVVELKKRTVPKDFTGYFTTEALINRPARKLFEAWLRKDDGLWKRLYHCVQNEAGKEEEAAPAPVVKAKKTEASVPDEAKAKKKVNEKISTSAPRASEEKAKSKAASEPEAAPAKKAKTVEKLKPDTTAAKKAKAPAKEDVKSKTAKAAPAKAKVADKAPKKAAPAAKKAAAPKKAATKKK